MNRFRTATLLALVCVLVLPHSAQAASSKTLSEQLSGRILLQVESYGRAWYVYPKDGMRHYMKNGDAAYEIMRNLGLGISDIDLAKIPIKTGDKIDSALVERVKGYILLQVERSGEAWYVNPIDGLRYYMRNGADAYDMMRGLGLGISSDNLRTIPMNTTQISPTYTFNDVAYTVINNSKRIKQHYADNILPLASVTKLMTALVLLDQDLDFEEFVTITPEEIAYPKAYVGDAATSEVDLHAGDMVTINDLWSAMLAASSNQAAIALANSTGLGQEAFVAAMNEKAHELGLTKTIFFDIAGLDAHNASTPNETAIFGGLALSDERISAATRLTEYTFTAYNPAETREVHVVNRNFSLLAFNPDGAKTGYLVEAEKNAVFKKDNIVITILHARTLNERNEIINTIIKEQDSSGT